MPNPFDETLKHLLESQPDSWLEFAGLSDKKAQVIDADLSTLTAEADKVLQVDSLKPYLAQLEFQSRHEALLPDRALLY